MTELEREDIEENIAIIKINNSYREGMTPLELYDVTRGFWKRKLESVEKADYVLSVCYGEVKEVYKVKEWLPAERINRETIPFNPKTDEQRVGFIGEIAESQVRSKYLGKSVRRLFKVGEADPVKILCDSKKRRPPQWNIYEAVVLLEYYIKVITGIIDRNKAISQVSILLRRLAEYREVLIDKEFRNEAGIKFQMLSMESAYYGKTIVKPASKLFSEVVEMRNNDKKKYAILLEETRQRVIICNKDHFKKWLINMKLPRSYSNALGVIDTYIFENGYTKKSLYEYEDVAGLVKLFDMLNSDDEFLNQYGNYILPLKKYILYRNEGDSHNNTVIVTPPVDVGQKRSEYQDWMISSGMKKAAARNYGNWLNSLSVYAIEKGYSSYSLYEYDNVEDLVQLFDEIKRDEDVVSNHRDYLSSLKKYIFYRSNGNIRLGRNSSVSVKGEGRQRYQEWLVESGMKDTAARNYGNWLIRLSEYAIEKGYITTSLYEYDDTSELIAVFELLCDDEKLILEHKDYLTSLKKYVYYRSGGSIDLGRRRGTKSISKDINTNENIIISPGDKERINEILNKFFGEGLVLNAIRLDKYRMLYEKEYSTELSDDDDFLAKQLKSVGIYIDGRIYPQHGDEQNNLLAEIWKETLKVLENGATCVYISAIMHRWQQELAEQLNIYNEIALRDLMITANKSGTYVTNDVIKTTKEKVYPDKDVVEFMKRNHCGVSYDLIKEELWYIPLDVTKRILVTTPSLVLVDSETYMYAPNFPASASELQQLAGHMNSRINEKGFLVSKDIAEIIAEKCPTIALNTDGYKDWAYRNVLKYIFQDYFEFGGSVVSKKGEKLEMWHVYRSFCRNFERLSLDELKEFSNEVGVQIYWDEVLAEMVRINRNEFIRRDLIHFDVEATDQVLDELCPGEYAPLKQIGLFLHFPTVGYPWNSFLLESYLQNSIMFKLYHVSYSENDVYGVLVRNQSSFKDYRSVVVDMLSRSNEWNNEENALNLIVEKGYQAKRRWTDFDKVVQEALLKRNY